MATIQIRDVPDDVHRVHRRRAAEAGKSLQEFLLSELIESARARTPAEVVGDVEVQIEITAGEGFSATSSAELVDAWYVALAETLDATLVTADDRLRRSDGPRCPVLAPADALSSTD